MTRIRFASHATVCLIGVLFLVFSSGTVASADDHGDDFQGASPIVLDDVPTEGRIDVAGDIDMFRIDPAAGGAGEIRIGLIRGFAEMKPFLALYDSDGKLITWRDDPSGSTAVGIDIRIEKDDLLYASVEDTGAGTGAYQLRVFTPNDSGPMWRLVSVSNSKPYRFDSAVKDARTYIDRSYRIRKISDVLKDGQLLRTANDDKYNRNGEHLALEFYQAVDLYVCYDKRGAGDPPDWLASNGWTRTSETVATSDWGASPYRVFHKKVDPGKMVLGGNQAGNGNRSRSNYFLIAKPAAAETITPKIAELIYVSSDQPYQLDTARRGRRPYIDRSYAIRSISSNLDGGLLVKTANDDKYLDDDVHLALFFYESADVYLCYDRRGRELPYWIEEGGWRSVAEKIVTDDRSAGPMQVFKQHVQAESELAVGGNYAGDARGAHSNYFLIVQPDDRSPGAAPMHSLTDGKPNGSSGSGGHTDQVTEPGQWRWAEDYYGHKGIDRIQWRKDRCGRWHNYAIGWHQNDLIEYLMKFGGRYNKLILRGIADRPGPVTVAVYVDAERMATVQFDDNDNCNQEVAVEIEGIDYGTHAIAVKFVNDRYKRNRYDRNLYLDALRVTGSDRK